MRCDLSGERAQLLRAYVRGIRHQPSSSAPTGVDATFRRPSALFKNDLTQIHCLAGIDLERLTPFLIAGLAQLYDAPALQQFEIKWCLSKALVINNDLRARGFRIDNNVGPGRIEYDL